MGRTLRGIVSRYAPVRGTRPRIKGQRILFYRSQKKKATPLKEKGDALKRKRRCP
jgi:hypothetical protein